MYTLNIFKRTFYSFPFHIWIPPIIPNLPIPKTIKDKKNKRKKRREKIKDKKQPQGTSLKRTWSSWATEQV